MTLQDLGARIKEKREASGLSLSDIAGRVKISSRILAAIEAGNEKELPHTVYSKSFTRVFGQMVGVDPEELNAALEEIFPADAVDESKAEPILLANPSMTYPSSGKGILLVLLIILVLAGLGGGGWYVASNYGSTIIRLVKKPFSAITRSESRPAPQAPAQAPATAATPYRTESVADDEVEQASSERSGNVVVINASENCIVRPSVDGAGGRDLSLRAGDSITLSYTQKLELVLNNAGAVTLTHNGSPLASPGQRGKKVILRFP